MVDPTNIRELVAALNASLSRAGRGRMRASPIASRLKTSAGTSTPLSSPLCIRGSCAVRIFGPIQRNSASATHQHSCSSVVARSRNYWRDLWRYRELFAILAWRDVAVRYKQTMIGGGVGPSLGRFLYDGGVHSHLRICRETTDGWGRALSSVGIRGHVALVLVLQCSDGRLEQSSFQCGVGVQGLFPADHHTVRRRRRCARGLPRQHSDAGVADGLVRVPASWRIVLLPAFIALAIAASIVLHC